MPLETPDSDMPESAPGTYHWSDRFWPPLQGNPFLSLVDPTYPGRIVKERKEALSREHRLADPPEPDEPESQETATPAPPSEEDTP